MKGTGRTQIDAEPAIAGQRDTDIAPDSAWFGMTARQKLLHAMPDDISDPLKRDLVLRQNKAVWIDCEGRSRIVKNP